MNIGYGKIILFGEHFVVYGLPAIASAVSDCTQAEIEETTKETIAENEFIKGIELIDNRPATPGYKEKKRGELQRALDLILKFMKIDSEKTPLKITLSGNLKCASGIGASAAMASSIARALSEHFNLNLNDDQINEIAYEGEKGSAGNPSGIDNTCSTYGGLLTFEKNLEGGPNKIVRLSVQKPVEIVIVNSGITQETKVVVGDVRKFKEEDEERFAKLIEEYKQVFEEGLSALKNSDYSVLGEAMNRNMELLRQITVSCSEMDDLIKTALDAGALGAKLTGTGRGGLMIALTPGKELQEKVAKVFEEKGFEIMKTKIGV